MAEMTADDHREVEVKLEFASADDARSALDRIGAEPVVARQFEDNRILDRTEDPLVPSGRLLRLRRFGSRAWLTVKVPVAGDFRHKVREEHETEIHDFEATRRIFRSLGFETVYRYEKYRATYRRGPLEICLDETPVGCFVELEGPADDIDGTAAELGYSESQYILASYRELHVQAARSRGREPGDMVFED